MKPLSYKQLIDRLIVISQRKSYAYNKYLDYHDSKQTDLAMIWIKEYYIRLERLQNLRNIMYNFVIHSAC